MADELIMPKLGLTMESGTIVRWLVDPGAEVAPGQPILVIETDKVESEVESPMAGRLTPVAVVGEEYLCGQTIGWFLADGEAVPALASAPVAAARAPAAVAATTTSVRAPSTTSVSSNGRLLASPNARRVAAELGVDIHQVIGTGPGGRITSEDVVTAPPPAPAPTPVAAPTPGAATPATFAARSLADLLGVDLAGVPTTGADPRITKDDVAAYVRSQLAGDRPRTGPAADSAPLLQQPTSVVPLSGMRGAIASRMSDSIHSMAQLTLTMDVDMDGVVADREQRKADAGDPPGYTDYVIAAVAAALVEHPYANSQVTDDGVAYLPAVNVGLAVALDDGLIVPVIADTPSLSLEQLAAETGRLATAARDRKLTLAALEGGTFSVTALGMYGVDAFTPIINGPNTAILGVGRLRDDVGWSDEGTPVRVSRMTLSLTWDHRAFDGAPAAELAQSIKDELEAYGRRT